MGLKRNWFTNSTVVFYMLLLIGVLAAAVYYPFINSGNGLFAVCLVSGIVVVIFLLTLLVLKLLAVEQKGGHDVAGIVIETVFAVLIIIFAGYIRMAPTVVFSTTDTTLFDVAAMLQKNVVLGDTTPLYLNIVKDPSLYGYGKLASLFFLFFGTKQEVILCINFITQILAIFFAYRFVRRITGKACAIVTLLIGAFLPSHIFDTYSMANDMLFTCLFFGAAWLFTYLYQDYATLKVRAFGIIYYILVGALLGVMVFFEPISVVFVLVMCVILFLTGRKRCLFGLLMLVIAGGVFVLLTWNMSIVMGMDYQTVISSYVGTFIPDASLFSGAWLTNKNGLVTSYGSTIGIQGSSIVNNYSVLRYLDSLTLLLASVYWLQLMNQVIYILLILFALIGTGFVLKRKRTYAFLPVWLGIGSLVFVFFDMKNRVNFFQYTELLIVVAAVGVYNIYCAFAGVNKVEVEEKETEEEEETVEQEPIVEPIVSEMSIPEQPVQEAPISEAPIPEITVPTPSIPEIAVSAPIVAEQPAPVVNYIENPLPLPKKHTPRRIDYAVEPSDEQMCFDVEVDDDANWDV